MTSYNYSTGPSDVDVWNAAALLANAQNNAQATQNAYQLGTAQNQTAQQGNMLDFQAAMAGVGANTQNAQLDAQTRVQVAQIAARQNELDRTVDMLKFQADLAYRRGEADRSFQMQTAAMQLEREKFGLQKLLQDFQMGMSSAEFLQRADQFNRQLGLDTARFQGDEANRIFQSGLSQAQFLQAQEEAQRRMGLDVARFNADEANRVWQSGMANAAFAQSQQEADRQYGLQRAQFGAQRQQTGAQQALDASRFGLDQQRFALDRDRTRAEMAANPYNAFANAVMVRGGTPSAQLQPYGTPGSGWAYGFQDQVEQPAPRINLPELPRGTSLANTVYQGPRPPSYRSPGAPTWLQFSANVRPPGVR